MFHRSNRASRFAVALVFAAGAAFADEYDSYVRLTTKDSAPANGSGVGSSFYSNDTRHWKKNGVVEEQGPHAGEKYYVPAGMILTTSNYTASATTQHHHVFGGDELVIADRLYFVLKRSSSEASTDASITIPSLVMLPGGHFYNAGPFPAICYGNIEVKGTSSNPSYWFNWANNGRPRINANFSGLPDSVFLFMNQDSVSTGRTIFYYGGDASAFYGTMRLVGRFSRLTVDSPGGFTFPGTLDISDGALFHVPAGDTATIGNLLSDGGEITLGVNDAQSLYAQLVVTNEIETNGKPVPLNYSRSFTSDAEAFPIVTLAAGANGTLSADDFAIVENGAMNIDALSGFTNAIKRCLNLAVSDGANGSSTLAVSHRKIVWQDVSEANSAASSFLPANKANWSDDGEISRDNDYFSLGMTINMPVSEGMTFGGASLTVGGSGILYFRGGKINVTVPDFRWVANGATSEKLNVYNTTATLDGKLTVTAETPGWSYGIKGWNTASLTIASEISGDGTLDFLVHNSSSGDRRALYYLTGLNTNFAGRIRLFHKPFTTHTTFSSALDTYCTTLTVSDSRNLGGALAEFDASGIMIASHSLLITTGSLTFSEPTRGWYIEDVGRVKVDAGETLTITNTQITYSGEFRKEGDGMLRLGGTARFTKEQSETPLDGTNVLNIAAGSFAPADATCCDGLAVKFAAGASLVLDAEAEGDLKAFGLYDVKWDAPITVEGGGALPVRFVLPQDFDKQAVHRFGICTVSPTAARSLGAGSFAVERIRGMKAVVTPVDNKDGEGNVASVTFACDIMPAGFLFSVR